MRVTTQCASYKMRFTLDDGTSALHDQSFSHNGRDYFFLGNVFYDLEDDLIKHIFGITESSCFLVKSLYNY